MAVSGQLAVGATLVLALVGAIIGVGGLASLQADTPAVVNDQFKPYFYMWYLGVLELVTLVFGLWTVSKDYHKLQGSTLALLAITTASISPLIAEQIYNTKNLPGGNGSATRGNITIAGLIIAMVGNGLAIFATAYHNLVVPRHSHSTASLGGGSSQSGAAKV